VGKVDYPSVIAHHQQIPLQEPDLENISPDKVVPITFRLRLTDNVEENWETMLFDHCLYIQVPTTVMPDRSKEGFVTLLEYAEEVLNCKHAVVCFRKERPDRAVLVRTFMFLGFTPLAPGHELAPFGENFFCMAYIIY